MQTKTLAGESLEPLRTLKFCCGKLKIPLNISPNFGLLSVAHHCVLLSPWKAFVLGTTLLLSTLSVTCIGTSGKCKYATVQHILRTETYWFWIFPVLRCLSHSLILNLSLPFWSRFVYQPTCYFYRRALFAHRISLLLKTMCSLKCVFCLEQHKYHCNLSSYTRSASAERRTWSSNSGWKLLHPRPLCSHKNNQTTQIQPGNAHKNIQFEYIAQNL